MVLGLVLSLLAAGVGYQAIMDSQAGNGLDRTSFVEPQTFHRMALATGVLGGDSGTGCLWLEREGSRTPVLLEHKRAGVDFGAKPPVVRTPEGVVARFGDEVSVGGGYDSRTGPSACAYLGTPFRGWNLKTR